MVQVHWGHSGDVVYFKFQSCHNYTGIHQHHLSILVTTHSFIPIPPFSSASILSQHTGRTLTEGSNRAASRTCSDCTDRSIHNPLTPHELLKSSVAIRSARILMGIWWQRSVTQDWADVAANQHEAEKPLILYVSVIRFWFCRASSVHHRPKAFATICRDGGDGDKRHEAGWRRQKEAVWIWIILPCSPRPQTACTGSDMTNTAAFFRFNHFNTNSARQCLTSGGVSNQVSFSSHDVPNPYLPSSTRTEPPPLGQSVVFSSTK